jgi:PAS domain S-box-containing protein
VTVLADEARTAEALAEIGRLLSETLDLDLVAQQIADSVRTLLGSRNSIVYRLDPESGSLVTVAVSGDAISSFNRNFVFPPGMGIGGLAVRERRPVFTSDRVTDPRIAYPPEVRQRIAQSPNRAVLAVPLIAKDRVIGALAVASREGRLYDEGEVRLAETFACQAALAMENARLYAEAERRRREAEIVADLARGINASLDLDTVLQRVADAAKELCGSDQAVIALRDGDSEAMAFRCWTGAGYAGYATLRIQPGKGAGGQVLRTGRPFRTDNYAEDDRITKDYLESTRANGIIAQMVVPIRSEGGVEGLLYAERRTARAFTDRDEAILLQLADHAAIAILNARRFEEAERRKRAAESLSDVGRLVSQSLDPDVVGQRIVDSVRVLLAAERATLFRLSPDSGSLAVLAVAGSADFGLDRTFVYSPGAGVVGLAVREGRPVTTPDLLTDCRITRTPQVLDRVGNAPDRAVLAVPLLVRGRAIGALSVRGVTGRVFGDQEVRLAQTFADQAAIAMENAQAYEEARQRRREAEIVAEIARDINASGDLHGVLQRVADAARELCRGDAALVALRDEESGAMVFTHGVGAASTSHHSLRIEPGKGSGGLVLLTGRPFRTDHYAEDPRITKDYLAECLDNGVIAQLVVPIRGDQGVLGLLYVDRRSPHPFTDRDETMLLGLADHAAIAIGNVQLLARERAARAGAETSEQRFRDLVQTLDAIVWEAEPPAGAGPRSDRSPRQFTFVSQRAERMLGYPVAQWLTDPDFWVRIVHPDERDRVVQACWMGLLEGRDGEAEYRVVAADGRVAWIRDIVRVSRDAEGRVRQRRGLMIDVTAHKAAEEERARLSSAVEQAAESVMIMNPEAVITYVNPAFERITGYAAAEVLGETPKLLRPPEQDRALYGQIWRTVRAGLAWHGEVLSRRKDGSLYTEEQSIAPLRDPQGEIAGYVAIGQDVGTRKNLESALRQAQKMDAVGRLAGGIAHDFNNMLAVILGRSDLLLAKLRPDDPLRRHIDLIKKTGDRAAALTRQLLAFSRKQIIQPSVLDLNAVVGGLLAMLRRLIGEDIELVTDSDPALGRVKADPGQIEQVIMNLVVNARDAMPRGGTLTIKTADVELDDEFTRSQPGAGIGPHVLLEVSDTGIGMDKDIKNRIFEPFFTTKELGKGTGLGLSTAYGIVRQHDGFITVDSQVDRGTTFRIYLPRVDDVAEPLDAREAPAASPRGSETVLLVEDEENVRDLACEFLQLNGYRVLKAANGGEALLICEQHEGPIHLMITDVVMPRMSGRELAERLVPLRPEMKVLYTSGYTDDALVPHGVLEPGTHFIEKPFTSDALASTVREVLDGAQILLTGQQGRNRAAHRVRNRGSERVRDRRAKAE